MMDDDELERFLGGIHDAAGAWWISCLSTSASSITTAGCPRPPAPGPRRAILGAARTHELQGLFVARCIQGTGRPRTDQAGDRRGEIDQSRVVPALEESKDDAARNESPAQVVSTA